MADLLHRLRSVGEPGSLRDMCREAAAEIERLQHTLDHVASWANAYPEDVFPEPDWEHVAAVLAEAGVGMDSLSGALLRRVTTGIREILAVRETT